MEVGGLRVNLDITPNAPLTFGFGKGTFGVQDPEDVVDPLALWERRFRSGPLTGKSYSSPGCRILLEGPWGCPKSTLPEEEVRVRKTRVL